MNAVPFRTPIDEIRTRSGDARAEWLDRRLAENARCPVARYMRGCLRFDRNRVALGVRDLMIAYHAEPQFESAALLVFAGLSLGGRPGPLLPALLSAWEEFRRPEFDRRTRERLLLDAFDEPLVGGERLSPLARRLWRLPILRLRTELRSVADSTAGVPNPPLLATM